MAKFSTRFYSGVIKASYKTTYHVVFSAKLATIYELIPDNYRTLLLLQFCNIFYHKVDTPQITKYTF